LFDSRVQSRFLIFSGLMHPDEAPDGLPIERRSQARSA
jgi:hypothetical protein